MSERLLIVPKKWVESTETFDENWVRANAPNLCRVWPDFPTTLNWVATLFGVSVKLLWTRIQVEQSAITYKWDGSTKDYGGDDETKLYYLCGVDKTDSGPREDGWFGPKLQFCGCAARFKYLYRGLSLPGAIAAQLPALPKALNGIGESDLYHAGVPVTRDNDTIIPANQPSADCLRYTSSLAGSRRLAGFGRSIWPQDYEAEEGEAPVSELGGKLWVADGGHGTKRSNGLNDTGTSGKINGAWLNEKDIVLQVSKEFKRLMESIGHTVVLTHNKSDYSEVMDYSERGEIAANARLNGKGYTGFISFHLDGTKTSLHGCTVFVPKYGSQPGSRRLASMVWQEIHDMFGYPVSYDSAKPNGVMAHWDGLGVFVGGDNWKQPGALVLPECGFMSSPIDMQIISQPDFYKKYALAVARACQTYIGQAIPEEWGGTTVPDDTTVDDNPEAPTELERATSWGEESNIFDGTRLKEAATREEIILMLYRALNDKE